MIRVRGAREHNLKEVDVELPRGALVFVTGPSGSGKTSLAFDTLCREGQRRYLETFSSYARQFLGGFGRPDARSIEGLSPAVPLSQRAARPSVRSTVGTQTELYDLLRLLFARLGTAPPDLRVALQRALFSFNSPSGACPVCQGLGAVDRLDPDLLIADPSRSLRQGALTVSLPNGYLMYSQVTLDVLDQVCRAHGFNVDIPWKDLTDEDRKVVLEGSDRIRIPYGKHPLESRLRWTGITPRPRQEGVYKGILPVMDEILRRSRNKNILRYVRTLPCSACAGTRLRPEALAVTFQGSTIAELAALPISELHRFFQQVRLEPHTAPVLDPIRAALARLCNQLSALGLGYLCLDRDSTTLSGGEAQRLRLGCFGGLGLRGVLYVLDEPSAGLHPRDQESLRDLLLSLRDQGNSVVVVEHEPALVSAADWIVDIGPAAGIAGGEVLFSGPARTFLDSAPVGSNLARSVTRSFLSAERAMHPPQARRPGLGKLELRSARRNNLQNIDATFLLGALNVITGVSGAGKSSLVEELLDRLGHTTHKGEFPRVGKVIAVDASPIGRTPRSNPATYTGLSDHVRDLFASLPEAKARGLGKGAFSFNVADGRCPTCEGAGVRDVGMRFLGTVEVRCETCQGRRFREDVLAVQWKGRSIHDVLESTVDESLQLFSDHPASARILGVLRDLGLGYLPLGHPATALSGGEAQRIKLATELAKPQKSRSLYVLDEPTVGLHPVDVEHFLIAIQRLVDLEHTVVLIEHDLDVIRSADHVIDLGPGSGSEGGRIVVSGTPEQVEACADSATGRALCARGRTFTPPAPRNSAPTDVPIRFTGVRTHNLRGVDVEFPSGKLTVVTGVSGSGKSSLAFDTLFAEGQNRFMDALSSWGRKYLPKKDGADFEDVSGLTPAIGVRQASPSRNPRSTVGSMTEVDDLLRLLLSRGGEPQRGLAASAFSPHTEQGACPGCKGLGSVRRCSVDLLITHPDCALFAGAMQGHKIGRFHGEADGQYAAILLTVGKEMGIDFSMPWVKLDPKARDVAMQGTGDTIWKVVWKFRRNRREGTHPMQAPWLGLARYVEQEYERKHADHRSEAIEPLMVDQPCDVCQGDRIREPARSVHFAGLRFGQWEAMAVAETICRLREIEADPTGHGVDASTAAITKQARKGMLERLERLFDAGLGYLSLSRTAPTLSNGEAQRVRIASHVDTGLTGITYVLDEPTRGLHARDTRRLVGLLRALCDSGNTVVVVEHDLEVIRAADHLIDLGPGAGELGGKVEAIGTPGQVQELAASWTGRYLRDRLAARPTRVPRTLRPGIEIRGACAHNLHDIDVDVPAGGLVAITGVSGSGKSSLAFDVIAASLQASACGCRSISLREPFRRVVRGEELSASAGPTSLVATRVGIFDDLRTLFAATERARERGWRKDHFSLGSRGGRCEACQGAGRVRVGLDFLPDAWVACEACEGDRFDPDTLACQWEGRSIADVLALSIEQAVPLLHGLACEARMRTMCEVGLGYVRLGQRASTLSGGERQRLSLALALREKAGEGPRLVILDEPTCGLHAHDVAQLLPILHALVDSGDTVVVVEHDLSVIGQSDHVIDLGPEGGDQGGRIVVQGSPQQVARCEASATGRALAAP